MDESSSGQESRANFKLPRGVRAEYCYEKRVGLPRQKGVAPDRQ